MNNFQNFSSEKFVSPPKIVADKNETYGSDQRRGKQGNRNRENCDNTRPSEALKIFYESENFYADEPHHEWIFNAKKKSFRDLSQKSVADEKKRSRKNWKKIQKREIPSKANYKKPNYTDMIESQMVKAKATGSSNLRPKPETQYGSQIENTISTTDIGEFREGDVKAIDFEKAPLNSLSNLHKGKHEQLETTIKPKKSFYNRLSPKNFQRNSNKSSDIKTTTSEYGKKHINDILKNHAQKIYASTLKTLHAKESLAQEATDSARNAQNALEADSMVRAKDEKEKPSQKNDVKNENNQETKPEDAKFKITEKTSKDTKKTKENKNKRGTSEEKKKPPLTWANSLHIGELEKKLKAGEESKSTAGQNKEGKAEANSEEEKKIKKTENFQHEDEKKSEKRPTYTDRLLLLKMVAKNLEEKKLAIEAKEKEQEVYNEIMKGQNKESKDNKESREKKEREIKEQKEKESKDRKENLDIIVKKIEHVMRPPSRDLKPHSAPVLKNDTISETNEICHSKDVKLPDSEQIIKTKPTRSTELRDLVTQAIKDHKIFCIFDNHTYIVRPVREELLNRGWLEVLPDRRLIPRRRPPPMGPTLDRDKATTIERNCNTIEAILTAKENFEKEIQETVSKSPSFRLTVEKPKPPNTMHINPVKKISEESLTEVLSQFRIIPPTADRKKNNIEIREFTVKYQAILQKEREREIEIEKLREKEKNAKNQKKEKSKPSSQNAEQKNKRKNSDEEQLPLLSTAKSIQEIIESLRDNQEVIMNVATEIRHIEEKTGGKITLGAIYDSKLKNIPALKESEAEEKSETSVKAPENSPKNSYTESEARAISKLIQSTNARVHFMWLSIKPAIHLKCFNYSPEIINKFQKTTFCTKIGLWSHLSNIQWYAHEVHHPAKSPRMYNTGEADDLQAFFQDFQLTACIGMLKWLSDTFFEKGMKAVQAKKGKVPLKAFEFAIKQCEKYIRYKENEDLSVYDEPKLHEDDWNIFLQWFYIITNDHGKIQESSSAQLMVVYTKAMETLKMMRRYWPEIDIDGRLNIWIMKPYCASCGRGIFMTNNVYYIGQHSKYIVQKYIERPLLIYNTKFDIRQWFMITKLTPLEIWMYKECYLRFCTQPFALRNLHESVHLSNNSVQRKYTSFRDPTLPDQNMWDSSTFQLYLKTIGHPNVWDDIIYPGMRDAIVSTMLAAQDTFDGPRKNWFEVYGADFMLSSNLKEGPWLIEINENPAMDPSTKVTSRLCPQMLRDVIKVVVDKRGNKNASTGQWELIYRQNFSPSYGTVDIDVRGKKIARVPHSAKVSVNLSLHPSSPPTRYSMEEVGPSRLYEYVKNFRASHNSERDKRKAKRTTKISEVEPYSKNSNVFKKSDIQAYVQNYTTTEIKFNLKKNYHKKEGLTASKIFGRALGQVKDSTDSISENNDSARYELDYKDSILVESGTKNAENTTPTKKTQKRSNRAPNLTENIMTFYSQFIADDNEKKTQNQSGLQAEKYKFTKHYKI